MSMRSTAAGGVLVVASLWAGVAHADSFSGFSGVDRPYLVNQDRVCAPIAVADGKAAGGPKCEKAAADVVARLSIKPPVVQSGAAATFTAAAQGRTITVSKKTGGAVVVAWDAPDPVTKIVDVYASQYEDRVAVAYNVRRAGREVTDVVAFELGRATQAPVPDAPPPVVDAPATADDPQVIKAVVAARAAAKPKAAAAWQAVLALDPVHPEALYRAAVIAVAAKHAPDAIASLTKLGESPRPDASEWLVEARFEPAFAALRADPKFRAAVRLDRKPATTYERLMGFGGQWEQSGTSCDRPEVRLVATRDRKIRIRVKTTCEGQAFDSSFNGTWRLQADRVVIQLPNQGKVTSADEAGCTFESQGDEDALRCSLGHDIDFVVLPTRR